MTRRVFTGGQVFDGTGSPPARADVVVLEGEAHDLAGLEKRIREVWRDGELVAVGGATVETGVVPPR